MPPVELKPLTVVVGRNNGGKSTLIQALLLLKQTLAHPRADVRLHLDGLVEAFSLRGADNGVDERPAEDRSNEAHDPTPLEACMQMSLFGGVFLRLTANGAPVPVDERRFCRAGTKSPWAAEVSGVNVVSARDGAGRRSRRA